MIKKILIFLSLVLFVTFSVTTFAWNCKYIKGSDVAWNLATCLWDSKVLDPWSAEITDKWNQWLKYQINEWITKIATILSILAVGSIVYWSFLMVVSAWEDEKIKKWKEVIKWSSIWLLWVVLASSLITIIVNLMYSV